MTIEQLEQAKVVDEQIKVLSEQIQLWKLSEGLISIRVKILNDKIINTDFVDFEALRTTTLTNLNALLEIEQRKLAEL